MAKRKDGNPRKSKPKKESLRAIYARYRREFTAADLQKYTEVEVGIPAEQVFAKMEVIHHRETQKRKKRK